MQTPRRLHAVRRLFVLTVAAAVLPFPAIPAAAQDPCAAPITNPIACENSKPGTPQSIWDSGINADQTIVGFSTDISVNRGTTVHFKISTVASGYSIDIYRMGYYGGNGARWIASVAPSAALPQTQPACLGNKSVGLIDCGNWAESASWSVPADAVSGIYFALLTRTDTGGQNQIVFIVRDDSSTSDLLFKTSDTTWEAYNTYGGNSFYTGQSTGSESAGAAGRAYKVSYNRPFLTRSGGTIEDFVFANEYPMVRFLEENGYNVSYFTSVDTARYGWLIQHHRVFLSVGHDEYWSGQERSSVESARDSGVNLAFFSGNEVYWKTRWESSIDGSGTSYRTLVCYKETWANAAIDPQDPPSWTGTWRDPRFSPPADGGRPENSLTGTLFRMNCCSLAIQVPAQYAGLRFWRNTAVAALAPGQVATLGTNTLGYEWDEDADNGFRPPGLMDLSSTTASSQQALLDFGTTTGPGTATHHLTLYRASSGALVFGAGTIQWSWGLDGTHDGGSFPPDSSMQQATINLLADMNAQPGSLMPGLVSASASTDTTPPTSVITSPASGLTFRDGIPVTITGTASDSGGVVAAVEVTTDGGVTWHPTNGTTNWSYTWSATTAGTVTIRSRAVDDSGNIETPSAGVTATVVCPCTLWSTAAAPTVPSASDTGAIEVGVKFRTDTDAGSITGIRFYKGPANAGTHVGHLWTATGTLIASATFTNESASGWQQASFATPVALSAFTTYVASYFAPSGGYAADPNFFAQGGIDSSPLHALRDGVDGPNGVFRYNPSPIFPTSTYKASNYWVDVVFTSGPDQAPPVVQSTSPGANSSSVPTSSTVSATFNEDVMPASVSFALLDPYGAAVAGSISYNSASRTATFQPASALAQGSTFSASISATDLSGNAMNAPFTWSFTTAGPRACPCSIWPFSTTPTITETADTRSVEVGMRFQSDVNGFITGIRFYKGIDNTGTHVVNLWTSSGTLLAQAVATNETVSGWQQVNFPGAIPVSAGTTYIASYFAPAGRYAYTNKGFATKGVDNAPLHALADGFDGPNGVFAYASGTTFPNSTYNSSNYWVDVVFNTQGTPDTTPPSVSSVRPVSGNLVTPPLTRVTATFNKALQASSIVFQVRDSSGNPIAGSPSYDPTSYTAIFTAQSPLMFSTTFTASVSASDLAGNTMPSAFTWSFATGPPNCACTIWPSSAAPASAETNDTHSIEVGVKFRADLNGVITGVRFYKGVDNTGTHIGNLWTASGTLLASAIFTNETATGWQQVNFTGAVPITAGTTYVASYFAPAGRYPSTAQALATGGADSPPLHALQNGVDGPNGVYLYTASSAFPTTAFSASNYWVDVVFNTQGTPDTTPPTATRVTPAAGATGVPENTFRVTTVFSEAVKQSSISFQLRDPNGALVPGTVTYDSGSYAASLQLNLSLAYQATYTATVGATDLAGNNMQPFSWSFTAGCPCTIWSGLAAPASPETSDAKAIEVGVKFKADVNGSITGIRFYKGPDNAGTHIGNLWTSGGALLASATFTNETASGWQQVTFAQPVAITAGTVYVASYFAPVGRYSSTSQGLSNGVDTPPLHSLANVASPNGVYRYTASSAFPTSSFGASNYWVDVVFIPA